jgi:NADPH:quinone reductase-like Zn-dependent oxidoreductase
VTAASINPSDVKNVAGAMEGTTLPRTPGRDFAGVVETELPIRLCVEVMRHPQDEGIVTLG